MTDRSNLLQSISEIVADYRAGEVPPRTPAIIDDWVKQFPPAIQDPLLTALNDVLDKTYISRNIFRAFFAGLATTNKLAPSVDPKEYWRGVNFLRIQQGGSSQAEILELFDEVLRETYGFSIDQTGSSNGDFIYLDDCIGTGSRLRNDVCAWLRGATPQTITLHVITPISFRGSYWVDQRIKDAAKESAKTVSLHKWHLRQFAMENRLTYRNNSDVLWPTSNSDDKAVQEYFTYLSEDGHPPMLRDHGTWNNSRIFANNEQRILIENAFLTRGCAIRREQNSLPAVFRPLGYSNLATLGFGSLFVMYRNCPNNCPLVWWVDQHDYPALFPRKTNNDSLSDRLV